MRWGEANMHETFIIQLMNNQHTTWQGTVTWAESHKTQSFRSALELIRLIDSALKDESVQDAGREPGQE